MSAVDKPAATLELARDFTGPAEAEWLRMVEKTLKGKSSDSLIHRTADNLEIRPLYGPSEHCDFALQLSDRQPEDLAWDIRSQIVHPDPTEANRQLLDELLGGASSALLTLDAGRGEGVRIRSAQDLAVTIEGVDLQLATIALDAGFAGPVAAGWLGSAANAAPRSRLAFHLDPLTAFAQEGRSPGLLAAHIAAAAVTAVKLHDTYSGAGLFLATGRSVHEAGGTDAQELAFAAAASVAYLRALVSAGLSVEAAFDSIVLGVSVDGAYFESLIKLRAARLIWDRLAQASGAGIPAKVEARASRRMLSGMDPWVNLLRLTAAGFAGAAGGADCLVLEPFVQPLGLPGELARRQARNTQLILMEEAHVAAVRDPAAGSWFLDSGSLQLAEAAWARFQAIESAGGLQAALMAGDIAEDVNQARERIQQQLAAGGVKMVGVNLHPFQGSEALPVDPDPAGTDEAFPNIRLPGRDDVCAPLIPMRWSEPFETQPEANP